MLDYLNLKIIGTTNLFLLLHYSIDRVLVKERESIRWFRNHVISNIIIVCLTFQDMIRLLECKNNCLELKQEGGFLMTSNYPKSNFSLTPSEMIVSVTSALHLYHLLFFNNLRTIDYMHHYLMLIVLAMSYLFQAACYQSMFMFFLSGLPGLIDYYLLSKRVERKIEKKVNVYLNNYIRSPGIIFTMGLYWRDIMDAGFWSLLIGYGLLYWNATYFNLDVSRSYYSYVSI